MRKNIMRATFVAAVALVAAMSVQRLDNQKANMSALLLANVEALADDETPTTVGYWKRVEDALGCYLHHVCSETGDGNMCSPVGAQTSLK